MRTVLAVVAGAVLAAVAAVILGEYSFSGWVPWVAGVAVPVAVGETAALIAGRQPPALWVAISVLSAGGLAWGAWLSQGHGLAPISVGGWTAIALGALVPLLFALSGAVRGKGRAGLPPGHSVSSPSTR